MNNMTGSILREFKHRHNVSTMKEICALSDSKIMLTPFIGPVSRKQIKTAHAKFVRAAFRRNV